MLQNKICDTFSTLNKIVKIPTSKGVLESVENVVAIKRTSGTKFPGETSLIGSVIPTNLKTVNINYILSMGLKPHHNQRIDQLKCILFQN